MSPCLRVDLVEFKSEERERVGRFKDELKLQVRNSEPLHEGDYLVTNTLIHLLRSIEVLNSYSCHPYQLATLRCLTSSINTSLVLHLLKTFDDRIRFFDIIGLVY